MTSVSSVGEMICSFARLFYTPQECPPSQPPRLTAARLRLMSSRCRGPSRSLCSWTSREKRRKQCLWNFLNIFYKNTFYNYAEQLIGFSLNCCTREWNSCNSPHPIVENIWYWTLCPPMHKRLKFFGCTTGPLSWVHLKLLSFKKATRKLFYSSLATTWTVYRF